MHVDRKPGDKKWKTWIEKTLKITLKMNHVSEVQF